MVPYGPPDIKFSVEIPKSPFGDIENFTKLAHDPIPPYHSATGRLVITSRGDSSQTYAVVITEVLRQIYLKILMGQAQRFQW